MGDDSWNYFYLDDKNDVCQGVGGSSGTGFFISTDGKIMTNKDVYKRQIGRSVFR